MNGVSGFVTITSYTRSASFMFQIIIFVIILSINLIETHILYTRLMLSRTYILFHPLQLDKYMCQKFVVFP